MINTHKVLNAVTSMQQNAQAALPVIPNNGNPQGAHNMPHQGAAQPAPSVPQQQQSPYYYPWLAPSSHMENIKGFLTQRQERLMGMMQQYSPQPIAPQAPPVQQPMQQPMQQQQAMPPVIPMAQAPNPTVI